MSSRQQDAKNERALKALLKLPDNRRCADCDTLGPQYVVTDFNIFVCAVCSGVHRQFNHRCKGVTMATFKPEEIAAIEDGGNALAMGTYLARWSPADLPKPTDRSPAKVRDWIEAVFVKKRFYAEPQFRSLDGGGGASASGRPSSHATPERGHLSAPAVGGALAAAAAPRADSGGLISLDDASGAAVPSAPPAAAVGWDAFGDDAATAAPSAPPAADGWAAFRGDERPGPAPAAPAPAAVEGWASFDTPAPAPRPPTGAPAATPSPSAAPASTAGWASFDTPAPPPLPSSSAASTPSRTAAPALPPDLFSVPTSRPASAAAAPPSLPPSIGGSPAQPVVGTASPAAAAVPADPFSTLVPGLRGALPPAANGHAPSPPAPAAASTATTASPPPQQPPVVAKASGNPFA